MRLDENLLLAEAAGGASSLGYRFDAEAAGVLREQIRRSLDDFGGSGTQVPNELGNRLVNAFQDLGRQLAMQAMRDRPATRTVPGQAEQIGSSDVAGLLEKLCPGFWPLC
jgi:hypothetical protein